MIDEKLVASCLADQLFPGPGEMAELMRAKDWTRTPLGPLESWPPSLRTAVSICLDSRHPIVLWWGPERWMFYNDAYRPMLGQSKHPQFLGGSGRECWAEIWDVIGPMMEQVLGSGDATWSENLFLLMQRHGYLEETYFTFSYSPIRDEAGRPCGIFNACAETTAHVLAERRMKMLREMSVDARTTGEAARRLAGVMERNAKDVPFALIYLADREGKELRLEGWAGLLPGTEASPARCEMTHADAAWPLARVAERGQSEIVSAPFDCLPSAPWGEAPRQAMLLPIARPGSRESAGVLVLGISPRRCLDDDYHGFLALTAQHVATALSSAHAFETERERAEKLTELDRAKTEFFSNVSHEFRTPLTLMLAPLEDELGERTDPLPRERHERLRTVHRNGLRLLKLVNSLLEFSRIEAGRVEARYEATDLASYTRELASSFHSAVDRAGLAYTIDCPPLPEPVHVDREMWEKIVLNLVSNAFKHTFCGEIAVRLRWAGEHVELAVSDTGTGISPRDQERLFERFHRVQGARSRTHEGSGIGLALVKELSALHGGSVSVESEVGKGSTFLVRVKTGRAHLPQERVGAGPAPASARGAYVEEALHWLPEAPESQAFAGTRPRILLADDNADMRNYVGRLLSPAYDVVSVPDGAAALRALREDPPPELILSDVMMPCLDGFGLLRELRADPRTRALPFILLSARAGEESAVEGLGEGADDYVVKPFSARELLARVRTHLETASIRRESARELERANKELEAFSYSVSHDLRAPLRAIEGYARLLLEEHTASLDAEGQRILGMVVSRARRMEALIQDLLEFSRLGRSELSRSSFDPEALVREVLDEVLAGSRGRSVDTHVGALPRAWGDRTLLRQVFYNLLSNAAKYSRTRDAARIEVEGCADPRETTYWVRDNGVGFPAEYAHKLFGVFQRLHSGQEFEGNGVGLALVQRIVERHGGRVWAEGATGRGATFYFTLPHGDAGSGSAQAGRPR